MRVRLEGVHRSRHCRHRVYFRIGEYVGLGGSVKLCAVLWVQKRDVTFIFKRVTRGWHSSLR